MTTDRRTRVERYLAVVSSAHAPSAYAGMDGLILTIGRTEREFARRQREPVEQLSEIWAKGTLRKLCAKSTIGQTPPDPSYDFVGHDVGHLHPSGGVYSLILNYLLNNRPSGTGGFRLNKHELFDTPEEATRLLTEWESWRPDSPGDKETFDADDVIQPYAIFKARNWSGVTWQ